MTETEETEAAVEPAPADDAGAEPARAKRRRSRSLRDLQKMERKLSKAALRMSRAVSAGIDTYCRERDRSAERTRDGALLEMPVNAAKGLAATLERSTRIPVDVARAFDTRTTRRAIRLGAKMLFWPLAR